MTSQQTAKEILDVLRKHIPEATIYKVVRELLVIKGNKSFRDTVNLIWSMILEDKRQWEK